jgi:signal transduction histidine kinase
VRGGLIAAGVNLSIDLWFFYTVRLDWGWSELFVATLAVLSMSVVVGLLSDMSKVLRQELAERKRAEEQLLVHQKRLQSVASELSMAQEEERRRVARELHDQIGQTLFLTRVKLGVLRKMVSSSEQLTLLGEIDALIEETIKDSKSLMFELGSPILYELGLEAALDWLGEYVRENYGLVCKIEDDRQPKPLDNRVSVVLFQAVRELLVNAAKHAQVKHVKVAVQRRDQLIFISVEDKGVGFDTSAAGSYKFSTEGFGLFSTREQLDSIGGSLRLESEPGKGTRAAIIAPLKPEDK